MDFKRRICEHPASPKTGPLSRFLIVCPDLWELDTGDFAAIGKDITEEVENKLPKDVVISEGECVILVPRKILTTAKHNIPEE